MLFNSYAFMLFFGVVLALHYMRFPWRVKKINLLLASYLFYALWNPPFVILLWLSTFVDFIIGKKIYAAENPTKRKLILFISLAVNLGLLGFFKYGSFLLDSFIGIASAVGFDFHPARPDIILPVGISFYTFQSLAYTLDMYKKRGHPEKSFLDFSLFVTFFPQLVAGPIVRPDELMPQFKTPHQATQSQFLKGLLLLSLGLFMKVVMADAMLAGPADTVFASKNSLPALDAWMGVLAFSGQIFFDFAGYSTCAIGVAACLGFTLPDNFRYPYAAIGFSDFWRRWHITLSTWLRDYLYIPLGGNRNGQFRTYINLMLTMLLGGLWHGASWTFVVWGGLHGVFLCVERLLKRNKRLPDQTEASLGPAVKTIGSAETVRASFVPGFLTTKGFQGFLLALLTFFLVNITWVFFRAPDFSTAWDVLASMFGYTKTGTAILPTLEIIKVSVITVLLMGTHWFMRDCSVMQVSQRMKWWLTGIVWALMVIIIIMSQKSSDSFIYFQF